MCSVMILVFVLSVLSVLCSICQYCFSSFYECGLPFHCLSRLSSLFTFVCFAFRLVSFLSISNEIVRINRSECISACP